MTTTARENNLYTVWLVGMTAVLLLGVLLPYLLRELSQDRLAD